MANGLVKLFTGVSMAGLFFLASLVPSKTPQEQAKLRKEELVVIYTKIAYPSILKSLLNKTEKKFEKSNTYETLLYYLPSELTCNPFDTSSNKIFTPFPFELMRVDYKASVQDLKHELNRCKYLSADEKAFKYEDEMEELLSWIQNNKDSLEHKVDKFEINQKNFDLKKALYRE